MQCILFNKNCVRKLKEKLCSKVKRKKKQKENSLQVAFSVLYRSVSDRKQKNNQHINQSYRLNNFVTLRNIQRASGNRPLKGSTLGTPVFHLRLFSTKRLFAEFSLVSNFFRSKKSRIKSYFSLFSNEKSRFIRKNSQVENCFKIKYVNKNFVNFIQISTASRIQL